MDYEGWRCRHDNKIFCPPEGCPKSYGCARDKGWKPGMESPRECRGLTAITPKNARVSLNSPNDGRRYGGRYEPLK